MSSMELAVELALERLGVEGGEADGSGIELTIAWPFWKTSRMNSSRLLSSVGREEKSIGSKVCKASCNADMLNSCLTVVIDQDVINCQSKYYWNGYGKRTCLDVPQSCIGWTD